MENEFDLSEVEGFEDIPGRLNQWLFSTQARRFSIDAAKGEFAVAQELWALLDRPGVGASPTKSKVRTKTRDVHRSLKRVIRRRIPKAGYETRSRLGAV